MPVAVSRTHCCLRNFLGLNTFEVAVIERAGDDVLPGALSSRYRGCMSKCAGSSYRGLWWYWQALKRNHAMLAPFLAPYDPTRGHAFRSAILLAKYAATVASAPVISVAPLPSVGEDGCMSLPLSSLPLSPPPQADVLKQTPHISAPLKLHDSYNPVQFRVPGTPIAELSLHAGLSKQGAACLLHRSPSSPVQLPV